MIWTGVLVGSAACYALKLGGLSLASRVPGRVQHAAALLPIALLATLVVTQTFATAQHLGIDARLGGVLAGVVAQRLRAPFLVVVAAAALTAALLRLLA